MTYDEETLSAFADLICGRGRWAFWGQGLHTYPDGDYKQRTKHAICEELERRGIVVGRKLDGSWYWGPVEAREAEGTRPTAE